VILALPKAILEATGLSAESQVRLSVQGRSLTITPSFAINDLVASITPENSHELIASGERGAEQVD